MTAERPPSCICTNRSPADYDGPQRDCHIHGIPDALPGDFGPAYPEPDCWGETSYEHYKGDCRHFELPTPEQIQFARSWGYDL